MLHRPGKQELLQLLQLQRPRRPPLRITQHQTQMIGAGLLAFAIPGQHTCIYLELVGQPTHRHLRGGRHLVGHEPQPRQHTQLHGKAQAIPRRTAATRIDERAIRLGECEVPDQFVAGDLRKTT